MSRFQGISTACFYDPDAGANDLASVVFTQLDAQKTKLELNAPAKGEKDFSGGSVFSGEMFRFMLEGADDDDSTRLRALREWLVANKRVSAIAIAADNSVVYNWREKDRLTEVRHVPVMGEMKGRADFVRAGLERIADTPDIQAQRNLVSHLPFEDITANTNTDIFFPIPGVRIYVSVSSDTTAGTLIVRPRDVAGQTIMNTEERVSISSNTQLSIVTPPMVHSIRVRVQSLGGATLNNLTVRIDGSYSYSPR